MSRSIGSSGSTGFGCSLEELLGLLSVVETLELLEVPVLDPLVELVVLDILDVFVVLEFSLDELSGTVTSVLLEKLLSELETLEFCTELLTALELCGEEDVSLTLTLITVAPEVSDVLLQPVTFAHIIKSDSAAAKNLDFLFIIDHSIKIVFQLISDDCARVCRAMTDLRIVAVKAVVVYFGSLGRGLLFREHRVTKPHDLARNTER